jgi:hypothetical protein
MTRSQPGLTPWQQKQRRAEALPQRSRPRCAESEHRWKRDSEFGLASGERVVLFQVRNLLDDHIRVPRSRRTGNGTRDDRRGISHSHIRPQCHGAGRRTYSRSRRLRLSCDQHGVIAHIRGLEAANAAAEVHQNIHGHAVVVTGPVM